MDFSSFTMKISQRDLKSHYGGVVSDMCKRMFSDPEKAKKVALEIYDKLIEDYDNLDPKESAPGWVFNTAKEIVIEKSMDEPFYSERSLREKQTDVDVDLPNEMKEKFRVVVKIVDEYLTKVIHNMDIETRYAYVLHDACQLPYKDISSIMGKSEHEMRKHISRTRRRLTNFLEESCIIYDSSECDDTKLNKMIKDIKLAKELKTLRRSSHKINILQEMNILTGGIDYWND